MKGLTVKNIAQACGGHYHGSKEFLLREVSSVSTDSRRIVKDALFIPIRGERFDGHTYIGNVMKAGALVTLTDHAEGMPDCPYILVENTVSAMLLIAHFYLKTLAVPVVGITGSVGKTSTKEMIASVLSQKYRVLKTAGNFNNNIGLPLTIFRLTEEDQVAVLEMGINHFGEMTVLAETAEPDIMVITNIGTCHLEFLGNRDGVFKAKTECFDYVKQNGSVILNGDDDKLTAVTDVHGRRPIFYGMSPKCRVTAESVTPLGLKGSRCTISIDEDPFDVTVPVPGMHQVMNALAGAAVGAVFGLTAEEIKAGIESMETIAGRFRITEGSRCTVIDDCYNANPMSMKASLGILNEAEGRRAAVLGDMGELGANEKELHREVGEYAGTLDIETFLLCGELSKELQCGIFSKKPKADVHWFASSDELKAALPNLIRDGDTVLVKASHFMQFGKIVEELLK